MLERLKSPLSGDYGWIFQSFRRWWKELRNASVDEVYFRFPSGDLRGPRTETEYILRGPDVGIPEKTPESMTARTHERQHLLPENRNLA
jgi:hypothetical protein